jgi:hypothetical protein
MVAGLLDTLMVPTRLAAPNCFSNVPLAGPFKILAMHEGVFALASELKSADAALAEE